MKQCIHRCPAPAKKPWPHSESLESATPATNGDSDRSQNRVRHPCKTRPSEKKTLWGHHFVRACAIEMHGHLTREFFCGLTVAKFAADPGDHLDWTPGFKYYGKKPQLWPRCLKNFSHFLGDTLMTFSQAFLWGGPGLSFGPGCFGIFTCTRHLVGARASTNPSHQSETMLTVIHLTDWHNPLDFSSQDASELHEDWFRPIPLQHVARYCTNWR